MKAFGFIMSALLGLEIICLAADVQYCDPSLEWVKQASEKTEAVPDFPKPGILFQDVLGIFKDPHLVKEMSSYLSQYFAGRIDVIVGLESRGFLLGSILSEKMQVPFIPIRKAGKLPGPCFQSTYKKEYGYDTFELAQSALEVGQKVLIVDDLIATGGSAQAAIDLISQAGAQATEFFAFTEIASEGGAANLPIPSTILFRK